ncbi:hypothetical protein ACWEQL_14465 [Kitasatospora sp. NPDC004240]
MVETIVALIGAVCTVLGLGISVATYRQQSVYARRTEERAARAERLADEARARSERESARREQELQTSQAQLIHLESWGTAVVVINLGRLPVTAVRLFWRQYDITPGGRDLDLQGRPSPYGSSGHDEGEDTGTGTGTGTGTEAHSAGGRWTNRLLVRVPDLAPEDKPLRLADLSVEFTDVGQRRWRKFGTGALYRTTLVSGAPPVWTHVPYGPPAAAPAPWGASPPAQTPSNPTPAAPTPSNPAPPTPAPAPAPAPANPTPSGSAWGSSPSGPSRAGASPPGSSPPASAAASSALVLPFPHLTAMRATRSLPMALFSVGLACLLYLLLF